MDVLGQVSSLKRATLLLECQSRALPGDGTATVSNVLEQLVGVHVVLVVPQPVEIGHAVRQQRRERAGQSVALAASSLQTTLARADDGLLAIGNVVDRALLDNGDATEGVRQLGAKLVLLSFVDVDVLALSQTTELDDVGREDAVLVAVDQVRASLGQVESIGVQDECDALFLRLSDDAGASLLHGRVASKTRADDDDVEAVEHSDHVLGDAVDRLVLADVLLLAHVGVHHEVGRVGLDD